MLQLRYATATISIDTPFNPYFAATPAINIPYKRKEEYWENKILANILFLTR
ncbi:hypothetical protein L3C95_15180 [Chitinophaga filiformis]|uniref:hypothetical protein n=1 Tax=Chitinophaga filiformis TaxID=104663 RepID=UPI001F2B3544|nr:hypothetical protein [Chitinophaga filiformis]MCF6404237.1 hypothetical protein [Chitinophaga filiformis]